MTGIRLKIMIIPKIARIRMESAPPSASTPASQDCPLIGGSPTTSNDKYSKKSKGRNRTREIKAIARKSKI
jgi:hypothetical protein